MANKRTKPRKDGNAHHEFKVGDQDFVVEVTDDEEAGVSAVTLWRKRVTGPNEGPDPEERWDDVYQERVGPA